MQKLRRQFILLVLLCVFALSIYAQQVDNRKAGSKKTITFWTIQLKEHYSDYMNELISSYEAINPDIKIKWVDIDYKGYESKLLATIIGKKDVPDVVNLDYRNGVKFAEKKVLVNLKSEISDEVRSKYIPEVWNKACTYDGMEYCFPWYLSCNVVMYNKKIFAEAGLAPDVPPKNYDELYKYCKQIKERTGKYGILITIAEAEAFLNYLDLNGVPIINEEKTKALFNNERGYETLEYFAKGIREGVFPRETVTEEHRKPTEWYMSGKSAIFMTGPQFLKIVKENAPDVYKHTGIGPQLIWGTDKVGVAIMNLCVLKATKNKKEAIDFAAFVTNPENQLKFCKIVTIMPSTVESLKDEYFVDVEQTPEGLARKVSAEQLLRGVSIIPILPHSDRLLELLNSAVQSACLGEKSVKEALDGAAEMWNQILADK